MSEPLSDAGFWEAIDELVNSSNIVIDRPKWSTHPRYPSIVYPLDYGFLEGTTSGDGNEIDVWVGSLPGTRAVGVAVTVDLEKRDSEIKILLGLTEQEMGIVYQFHNEASMSAVVLKRPDQSSEDH